MNLFISCLKCQGSGFIKSAACPKCGSSKSPSIYLKIQDNLLYFDFKKISPWEISKRRAVLKLDFIINFILYITALLGILFLAYYVYQKIISLDKFSLPLDLLSKNFWDIKAVYLKLFLISFFLDLYLIYRLSRAAEQQEYVIKKNYKSLGADIISPPSTKAEKKTNITNSFDNQARQLIEQAYLLAHDNHYQKILPLHLLSVLMTDPQSNIILFRLGLHPGVLAGKIKRGLERTLVKQINKKTEQHILIFSPAAKQIILQAYFEVYNRGGVQKVGILDLWIPLAEIDSYAREILYDLDIEPYKLRHVVLWRQVEDELRRKHARRSSLSIFKSKHGMNRAMTAVETRTLNAFSQDLTVLARRGVLPPSLGHGQEMEQIFTILQSGAAGVVLIGPPGIGKQSMVQELAQRMAAEQVPEALQDKRLVSLSVAGILAGGDPARSSERLHQALLEAAHSGNIVLFIKDIHNLAGIGLKGEAEAQTLGIAGIVSQAMELGRFLVIGTTDQKSYTRYLENSPLSQVLTKIEVREPEPEETVLMLEARVPFIEAKHKVFFTYQALAKTVELTNKLIHTEHQPAKALKILQQTASYVANKRGKGSQATQADVAQVLSAKINMPLSKIEKGEEEKLMNLEEQIHQKYINQDYAVSQVAAALRRARAELRDEHRPIANFLFVGPTGVGKTELAKRIAEIYFNSENDIIRIDMSEFQEVASINRLIGISTEPGLLTEAVKNNPYSILLLDEIEKAHKNIANLFLQVLDDGRLTSGQGEIIDFTNLIIVATSNAGTTNLQDKLRQGRQIAEIKEEFVKQDLLAFFRPEFLNRFDDVIVFAPLSPENIEEIAGLILTDLAARLEQKGISLKPTPDAVKALAQAGFDPLYGARPLRRAIQEHVQNALANFLISGKIDRRDIVYLEKGGKIRIEKAPIL